ncbi:thiamine-phosphate kinase [Maricaulis sp. CAU 1757]
MMAGDGEFDFIRSHLKALTRGDETALELSDDAAILQPPAGCELVLASDMLVEGVHFLATDSPQTAAARALRSNLSDLAAMGAEPMGYLASQAWPADRDAGWRAAFAAALSAEQAQFGLSLWGGDTTSTPGPLTISLTLIGRVPAGTALKRSGARAGDDVWVSGVIGDGLLGLHQARAGRDSGASALQRYQRPDPRLALGAMLRSVATACIDVSDGLVADAGHVAAASELALVIDAAAVPLSDEARAWLAGEGETALATLLTAGDDYELLFTAPGARRSDVADMSERLGVPLSRIGQAGAGEGVTLRGAGGAPIQVGTAGFTHF